MAEQHSAGARQPTPARRPLRNASQDKTRTWVERLARHYMWDDIGIGEPFRTLRKLPVGMLLAHEDAAKFGAGLIDAMRDVARQTMALQRQSGAEPALDGILAAHAIPGFDEYVVDVMRRLTCSVIAGRHALFLDHTDLEIFGKDFIVCAYRLALFEVKTNAGA